MVVQSYFVGINIIVEHFLSGMRIVSKEDSFGVMVFQLGFYISGESHIDTISKVTKVREFILLGFIFINW